MVTHTKRMRAYLSGSLLGMIPPIHSIPAFSYLTEKLAESTYSEVRRAKFPAHPTRHPAKLQAGLCESLPARNSQAG